MKATITLTPAEVYEIVRNHLGFMSDVPVLGVVAQVSCERDELPEFDGIKVTVEIPTKPA